MCEGEKRKLKIPSDLAYGTRGSGSGKIGPNEDLVFEVELLKIHRNAELWIIKNVNIFRNLEKNSFNWWWFYVHLWFIFNLWFQVQSIKMLNIISSASQCDKIDCSSEFLKYFPTF